MNIIKKIIDAVFQFGTNCGPWFDKAIIIANVLAHDWRLRPAYGVSPGIASLNRAEIESVYSDIDKQSLVDIIRFYECCHLPNFTEKTVTLCFHNVQKILTKEERKAQAPIRRELSKLHKKYGMPLNIEAGYYHHGLRDIPNAKEYLEGKGIIDAGACNGDSALIFLDFYNPAKVYSFEPSPLNCADYTRNLANNQNSTNRYCLLQKGLGAKKEIISFQDSGRGGNNLEIKGDCKTEIVPLDEFRREISEKIGVIKADVEGMGLQLVKGAEQTIREDRPILLLSIYHNPEEFLCIYKLLKSWDIKYRISVRLMRLPMQIHELDIIACPNELL